MNTSGAAWLPALRRSRVGVWVSRWVLSAVPTLVFGCGGALLRRVESEPPAPAPTVSVTSPSAVEARTWVMVASAAEARGDVAAAVAAWRRALVFAPGDPWIHTQLRRLDPGQPPP